MSKEEPITVTLKMKIENADTFGYNAEALKVYLAVAGFAGSTPGLAEALEMSRTTAYMRMVTGEFKRREIQMLVDKLHLTPDQARDIFFNGKEGVYKGAVRSRRPNGAEEIKSHRRGAKRT